MLDNSEVKRTECLVIGGSGLVGGYIVDHLVRRRDCVFAVSRSARSTSSSVQWIQADLTQPDTLKFPKVTTLYCTSDAILLAKALPAILSSSINRVVALSSTSVLTKQDTEVAEEREIIRSLTEAEQTIARLCEQRQVSWTILRPTLIYAEGRDTNITPLSRLIRRAGFMPVVGGAKGLRQPVHAEDLALGAIAAAESPAAGNKFYSLPGPETLPYSEMIGRVFDGMGRPRRLVSVSPWLWRIMFAIAKPLYPTANVAMGLRMMKDMTFDATPAIEDFGWNPRLFHPVFDQDVSPRRS